MLCSIILISAFAKGLCEEEKEEEGDIVYLDIGPQLHVHGLLQCILSFQQKHLFSK